MLLGFHQQAQGLQIGNHALARHEAVQACLLYTSDAADERSSVDLGGRRIIKKKKERKEETISTEKQYTEANRDTTH